MEPEAFPFASNRGGAVFAGLVGIRWAGSKPEWISESDKVKRELILLWTQPRAGMGVRSCFPFRAQVLSWLEVNFGSAGWNLAIVYAQPAAE